MLQIKQLLKTTNSLLMKQLFTLINTSTERNLHIIIALAITTVVVLAALFV